MTNLTGQYLRLNILRDKLNETIENFFYEKDNCSFSEIKHHNGNLYRLNYTVNNVKEKLDFFYNNDGTTSLSLNSGGVTEFKKELADSIISSPICTVETMNQFKNPYIVIQHINFENLTASLDMFKNDASCSQVGPEDITGGKKWVLSTTEGERVTISHYFKSEKTLIQGRPLRLFSEIYTTFLLLLDRKDLPKVMEENLVLSMDSQATKNELEESLDIYIPNASNKINIKIKKLLCQSVLNLKVQMDMFEYSFLAFPALKALEGHLKYIMQEHGILLEDKKFSMFEKLEDGKYVLTEDHSDLFTTEKFKAVNEAYNFYNKNRHSLFHWADLHSNVPFDRTRMIDTLGEARAIISNTFEIIDSYYID